MKFPNDEEMQKIIKDGELSPYGVYLLLRREFQTKPTESDLEKAQYIFKNIEKAFTINPLAAQKAVVACAADLLAAERASLPESVESTLFTFTNNTNERAQKLAWIALEDLRKWKAGEG